MRSLVQRALAADRFYGRRVVSVLPSPQTRILSVTYQVNPGQSDAAALLKVMADRLEQDLSHYVIDYLPVRAEKQVEERLAIVAVAKRESVIDYLEVLRKSGLEAARLDIGPAAIRRLVSVMAPRGTHDNVLAINFGRQTSYVTVVSGARLLFDQEVQFGEQRLLDEIAAALEMSVEAARDLVKRHSFGSSPGADGHPLSSGAVDVCRTLQEIVKPAFLGLADEINRALIYTASETHGEPVSRIYLLGSLARWQGTDHLLTRLVKLPVETMPDPLKAFGQGTTPDTTERPDPAPEIAVATGLALSGMIDDGRY
jgi:type IV pilus assembly protein PilM